MNWTKILQVIKRHKKFLVATHVNPDPDALASQLSMCLYLKSQGKEACPIHAEEVPGRFCFMPGFEMIQTYRDGCTPDFDVVIILDCGDLGRIDKVSALLRKDMVIVNIDHHVTNTQFGNFNYVDPKASSTAEILFAFFKHAKFQLTKDISSLLYLGIMTDTGSFRYETTTGYTHAVISELMRFKFPVSDFYRKLYEQVTWKDLKFFLKVVNRYETFFNGQVICLKLRKNIMDQFSSDFDVRDKIFSFLRAVRGLEVIVILTEYGAKMTRVNFRAQGDQVNVAEVAHYFKGGGHRKASGCVIAGNFKQTQKKVLALVKERL